MDSSQRYTGQSLFLFLFFPVCLPPSTNPCTTQDAHPSFAAAHKFLSLPPRSVKSSTCRPFFLSAFLAWTTEFVLGALLVWQWILELKWGGGDSTALASPTNAFTFHSTEEDLPNRERELR
mmetsp:Transcript_29164/g.57179  ORF Transcript_29164/g.57179 Transcript_29164/m.57179 type:complete len:121 (-) Transcript_29164:291-653(-)